MYAAGGPSSIASEKPVRDPALRKRSVVLSTRRHEVNANLVFG
jgi:hypothetical protein